MEAAQLENELIRKGLKLTKPRQAILQALARENEWVTASDLYDKLLEEHPRMDFSTVCRNLDTLSGLGILCRVDRDNKGAFAYCLPETEEHHHHLICRLCGKISPLDYCPLGELSNTQTREYQDLECRFEVYGTCKDCQAKND